MIFEGLVGVVTKQVRPTERSQSRPACKWIILSMGGTAIHELFRIAVVNDDRNITKTTDDLFSVVEAKSVDAERSFIIIGVSI